MSVYEIRHGNCIDEIKKMEDNSVDSIVTDPPYELGFMAKKWDSSHRMVCAVEDAGFEVRDQILYVYGNGFPKSLNVSKQLDKMAGAEREVVRESPSPGRRKDGNGPSLRLKSNLPDITAPSTLEAKQWDGWGTGLKPAVEPIVLARKPISESTVAKNVLRWGVGALNIDGCRVNEGKPREKRDGGLHRGSGNTVGSFTGTHDTEDDSYLNGRFPSNLIYDGSDEVEQLFPNTKSGDMSMNHKRTVPKTNGIYGQFANNPLVDIKGDKGSASRFFYCAKPSTNERNLGTEELKKRVGGMVSNTSGQHVTRRDDDYQLKERGNFHPTVKPITLMRYLIRLVTPPNGTVLDPFNGSGTTGIGAITQDFCYIGIEQEQDYVDISNARLEYWSKNEFKDTKVSTPIQNVDTPNYREPNPIGLDDFFTFD